MSDKRRKSRIQGGWTSASKVPTKRVPIGSKIHSTNPNDSVTDGEKKSLENGSQQKFVFEESCIKVGRHKPAEKTIEEHGIHEIGVSVNGVSRICYFPDFIEEEKADQIFDRLHKELPWRQRSDVWPDGRTFLQPRLTAWYGDLPYTYSGQTHQPNPKWHPVLQDLREHLQKSLGIYFNSMLANLYRDGHDSVGWHTDKNPALGEQPTIASLSFGDSRTFELRKNPPPEENGDYTYMEHLKVPLIHGSLLTMEGALQHDWQHRVPKEYHDRGPRINLTFRLTFPE